MFEIYGAKYQVESLIETVFNNIAIFEENGAQYYAYECVDVDDENMMLKFDTSKLTGEATNLLFTVLYYRFADAGLTGGLKLNAPIPEPVDNHFRMTVAVKDYEKFVEEYFIYNGIQQDQFTALIYPVSLTMAVNKAELIAINLTDAQMKLLNKQAKTQVVAKKVGSKIESISNTLTATSKITMQEVVNPLAVATTKVGATIASGMAKTAVDCALTAVAEVAKDASSFSLKELAKKDEVQTIKYCMRKIMNKGAESKPQAKNNFSF